MRIRTLHVLNDSNPLRTVVALGLLVAGLAVVWLSVAPGVISLVSIMVLTVLTAVLMAAAYFKTLGRDGSGLPGLMNDLDGAAVVPAPIPRRGHRGSRH